MIKQQQKIPISIFMFILLPQNATIDEYGLKYKY